MARANSLILPRSTVMAYGGYSLPTTPRLSWIGIRPVLSSSSGQGTSAYRRRRSVRDGPRRSSPFHPTPRRRTGSAAVGFEQGGVRPDLHADGSGGKVAHLDH